MPAMKIIGAAALIAAGSIALPLYAALDRDLPRPEPEPAPPLASLPAAPAAPAVDAIVTGTTLAPPRIGDALRTAIDAVEQRDVGNLLGLLPGLAPLDRDIALWLAIRRDLTGLDPATITDFATRKPHWPSATLMRRRAEQALSRTRSTRTPEEIVAAFAASPPITTEGIRAYADTLIALGRKDEAAAVLGPWWASERLSPQEDAQLLQRYGDVLTAEHHKARWAMLMYADRVVQASAFARRIGPGHVAITDARAAVLRGNADAGRKLDAVPKDVRTDPLFAFTRAEWHRKADRLREAARDILSVDPKAVADHGDEWWIERRIVSRGLVEAGEVRLGYDLVAGHLGGDAETMAEAHFHAGWYALRFLADPAAAERHFTALQRSVSMPLSRSRAAYWLGRAAEAAGRIEDARRHFGVAATDEFTFYGQLARVKLNETRLGLPPLPVPTETDRKAFSENDLVRAIALLDQAGRWGDTPLLFTELSRNLPSGGQLVLLAELAERRGEHRLALQVGKIAADRGLGVERLAFPLDALPEPARGDGAVETAMVYAIARQESAFDPVAVSHAGAKGLLQLLPSTAAATAKSMGLAFAEEKLTADPAYNATLGAAHLRELVDDFGGSYVLAFAAYNAGPRRAREWIQRFGDPRDPKVDPIDWIELIPFGETRNYVQRVTENLQVYRERLHDADLGIAADLRRGMRG